MFVQVHCLLMAAMQAARQDCLQLCLKSILSVMHGQFATHWTILAFSRWFPYVCAVSVQHNWPWLAAFVLPGRPPWSLRYCSHLRWDHLGMHFPDFINLLDGYFVRTEQKYMKPQTGQCKGTIAITSLLEERLKPLMYQLSDACLWHQQLYVYDSG